MSQKMQDDIYRPQIGDKSTPRPQPDYEDGDVFIFNQFRDISAKKTIALPLNIIIICTQGRMQLDVNARTLVVESSNILICPTNTILSNELFSSDFECKVMGITDRFLQAFLHSNINIWNETLYINKVNIIEAKISDSIFYQHLYEMIRLLIDHEQGPYHKEMMQLLVGETLLGICSILSKNSNDSLTVDSPRAEVLFHKFIHLVSSNKIKRQPVEYYARNLRITPKYLSLICKRISGKTALHWIEDYVMEDVRYYLRNTDLSIKEIARFMDMVEQGDASLEERLELFQARRDALLAQMDELKRTLNVLEYKCWYYDVARESGTCDTPKNMPFDELPKRIQRIKAKCRINRY